MITTPRQDNLKTILLVKKRLRCYVQSEATAFSGRAYLASTRRAATGTRHTRNAHSAAERERTGVDRGQRKRRDPRSRCVRFLARNGARSVLVRVSWISAVRNVER